MQGTVVSSQGTVLLLSCYLPHRLLKDAEGWCPTVSAALQGCANASCHRQDGTQGVVTAGLLWCCFNCGQCSSTRWEAGFTQVSAASHDPISLFADSVRGGSRLKGEAGACLRTHHFQSSFSPGVLPMWHMWDTATSAPGFQVTLLLLVRCAVGRPG